MPDILALFQRIWQQWLLPLLYRLSVRVSPKGMIIIAIWTLLIIIFSFIKLIPVIKLSQNIFIIIDWFLIALSIIVWLAILLDYIWLLFITQKKSSSFLNTLKVYRKINRNLPVQTWSKVTLILTYSNVMKGVNLTLIDNYPLIVESRYLPVTLLNQQLNNENSEFLIDSQKDKEKSNHCCEVIYEVYPTERGFGDFAGIDMLLTTSLGLLSKYCQVKEEAVQGLHDIRILANFSEVIQGNLLGITQKTALMGILKQQKQGQGQDFRQIRNYIEGDSIRHIDWKATARHHRLMTREFQDERDQQILFLLDCGQHMRHIRFYDDAEKLSYQNQLSSGSHLDQALNAMLLLAEVANRQGDATGFITFASEQDKIVSPKKGQQVISYLLNQSFDIQPSMQLPDYIAMARIVRNVQKKRALLILITNTRQEEQGELIEALKLLSAKYVVILANLYEQDLKDYLEQMPKSSDDALTYHSVQEYLNMRERLHKQLTEQTNIYPLNCTPEQLPSLLIHRYLKIKHKHRL